MEGAPTEASRVRVVGALCAFSSSGAGFGGVALGLANAPWFSWTADALSDLGHPSRASASYFNVGLAASGLFYLGFAYAVASELGGSKTRTAAAACLAFGG